MKRILIAMVAGMTVLLACEKKDSVQEEPKDETPVEVTHPYDIESPTPTEQVKAVELTDAQRAYVDGGNRMGFRLLGQLYDRISQKSVICSPLSLQYALAMCANGASGKTLEEMVEFLGYGDNMEAMNAYCNLLLNQLPAVDLDVTMKLTDALLVRDDFPLQASYQQRVQDTYYAVVENDPFKDPAQVAGRVNEWAYRNTNGFIDKVLDPQDIDAQTVALLMNALYFKAQWAKVDYNPMFNEEFTQEENFYPDGTCIATSLPMMRTTSAFRYAEMDGFNVLELPYAGGKYCMYILLPSPNGVYELLQKLPSIEWSQIMDNMKEDAEVSVVLPKFALEEKYSLKEPLMALGMSRAFSFNGEFDRMFARDDFDFCIGKVIQKARIAVDEWGTEAGAVTVVEVYVNSAPGNGTKRISFICDHPFVFAIGERTSGTILFEGVYTGK